MSDFTGDIISLGTQISVNMADVVTLNILKKDMLAILVKPKTLFGSYL